MIVCMGSTHRIGARVTLIQSTDRNDRPLEAAFIGACGVITKINGFTVWIRFDADAPGRLAGAHIKVARHIVVSL
jgi:hypothetical protein